MQESVEIQYLRTLVSFSFSESGYSKEFCEVYYLGVKH
jgi:hypothetical protein